MDWLVILYKIFEVCIIPLLGILSMYVVKLIKIKTNEILNNTDSEMLKKYIEMLSTTISDCVSATTQTYVDNLKASGKFDEEAQKIAFNKTFEAVMNILTEDAKEYLTEVYGDLNTYITNRIEAEVKAQK